jgi:hypothetical protein
MTDISALSAEFDRAAIHWRAQSLNKDGNKALALAYLDARDVMDRLDAVCGPANWSDSYVESAKGRVICTISIKCGDEWVSKSDGAGDTDVEGEKGGISDAFKRAAVKWGVGRYLYRMPSIWVPCESTEFNGKKRWKKWTANPWDSVRKPEPKPANDQVTAMEALEMQEAIDRAGTMLELQGVYKTAFRRVKGTEFEAPLTKAKDARKAAIELLDQSAA